MAAVRSSKRVSIAWSEGAAYEDTDTLVLTINGYSLDLRVYVSGSLKGQMEWSTVARVVEVEGSTKENPILRWDHIINSRASTDMEDEGSFKNLDNGDVREQGTMWNPATEKYESYIEVWRRLRNDEGSPFCFLEKLRGENKGTGTGTFIGRVGDRALGFGKVGDVYVGWRDQLEKNKEWNRVYEFGLGLGLGEEIPSLPVVIPEHWKDGVIVSLGTDQWVVHSVGRLS